jgi:transposase
MDDDTDQTPDCPGCRKRDEIIERQQERIDKLESLVAELQGRVASLEARLEKDSTNSSKPPSSDGPKERAEREGKAEGQRDQGAQPGHEGHHRQPADPEEVDEVHRLKPEECRACGHGLSGCDPSPTSHQIWDIEILQHIIEYRRHTLECPSCGTWTEAQMPDDVPDGHFGPTISAVATYLTGELHVSRRDAVEALAEVFGIEMSLGTVSNKEAEATDALEAPYQEARGWVTQSERVHLDETSWMQGSAGAWLWVITDGEVAAYLIDESRSGDVARELLDGQPAGDVITDRHTGYNWIATDCRHVCWAHLYRNFKGWALEDGPTGDLGALLVAYTRDLFAWLERIRDGTISERRFRQKVAEVRDRISLMLHIGASVADPPDRFTELLAVEEAMWSFVDADGWPVVNNEAERAVRDGVLWRKQSFGTESDRGSRFVERMLTVVETLKGQARSTMDFLKETWRHIAHNQPMPRLLSS